MRSPLTTELVVFTRIMSSGRGETPNRHLTSVVQVLAAAVLLACLGYAGSAQAAPAAPAAASDRTLMRSSWYDNLRDFLKEEYRRKGGHLEQWPDSTIDDAPVNFVQAVYEQMGGDPSALDLRKTDPPLVDMLLYNMYLAIGGSEGRGTLLDGQFDARSAQLWAYFEFLGGQLLPE